VCAVLCCAGHMQLIDVGRKIIAHRVYGFLPTQIMGFVSNLHIAPRQIWLTRHGESIFNTRVRVHRCIVKFATLTLTLRQACCVYRACSVAIVV